MSQGKVIHFPTPEEDAAAMQEFLDREKRVRQERIKAAVLALPALKRLCRVLCDRSGQCYKVRALLYSLWNGKPAQLIDVVGLDWEIRQDLCAVILAFGFECDSVDFFYDAITREVRAAGQWQWFLEERFEYKVLEDYAQACKEAE